MVVRGVTERGRGLCVLRGLVVLSLGLALSSGVAAEEPGGMTAGSPPTSPIEQALVDLQSEEAAVRTQAAALLIEQGDAGLIPRLDEIREGGSRAVRIAVKPVVDLLKNRANLTSASPDTRRSAAADLGSTGRPEAIPYLKAAAAKETVWWVRYTMEEAQHFLELQSDDLAVQLEAVKQLGELRSGNSVPALKELIEAGNAAEATDQHKALATAATAAVDYIESWGWWANAIETLFRGISLSSILLIMSLKLAIVFDLMGVINMAHGELMMIGTYATFVTQQAFLT